MHAKSTSDALEQLLEQFGSMVHRTGRERGFSPPEIDELRQDVRVRLWQALGHRERMEQVAVSYVQRTVVSAALDFIRRRRARQTEPLVDARETGDTPIPITARVSGPDRAFARRHLGEIVAREVEELSDSRRVVVRLYLAGYSHTEIAKLLEWREPKTRNLLYRGLDDLRTRLEALGIEPGRGA